MGKIRIRKSNILKILPILLIFIISGCAHTQMNGACIVDENIYGFWGGLWHGFILTWNFIGTFWYDDVVLYATNNNGMWYNIGFIIGTGNVWALFKMMLGALGLVVEMFNK